MKALKRYNVKRVISESFDTRCAISRMGRIGQIGRIGRMRGSPGSKRGLVL